MALEPKWDWSNIRSPEATRREIPGMILLRISAWIYDSNFNGLNMLQNVDGNLEGISSLLGRHIIVRITGD